MTTYFEYGVSLTNNQKSKLASAIRNNFQNNLQKHKQTKLTRLIKHEDDWLLNQQENKLKEYFGGHQHLLEFQWRLVQYQKCLEVDFKLINNHHRIQEMFMYHLFKHMVKNITHIFHNLITEAAKSNFNGSKKKKAKGKGKGKGLLLGPNSPFNSIPVLGSIL